ncbi:MAG: hypothetical protein SGILL_010383 [Bacillariaceae sp.]
MEPINLIRAFLLSFCCHLVAGWQAHGTGRSFLPPTLSSRSSRSSQDRPTPTLLFSTPPEKESKSEGVEEYRNTVTKVLSNLMQKDKMTEGNIGSNPIAQIDFDAPKISPSTSLQTLAAALDYELSEREWFVTGNVDPSYFSDDFKFQDPDVKVNGIEDYSKGVYKLFDQATSRAEIISTVVNEELSTPDRPVITCTWRLSGGVSIGPGLEIKPYIVFTDFAVDPETSLIVFQEDRFDLPGWDILLSALFPFLIGKMTKPPAPPVEKRVLTMPRILMAGQTSSPLPSMDISSIFKSFLPNNQ